ncbi:PAS domain-containing protein [Massilia sp. erpn]|uniref:PAS domain-containing sensor histidine kinase n=1 Tax=Massilia sp. erpn TaxID=2738142 RepID=UPI0021022BFE|nr:PAS domain-containing protein [Massilia sp. erpn]UTY60303.1 PAS domain-containing protein [Massilia sp. erpn]
MPTVLISLFSCALAAALLAQHAANRRLRAQLRQREEQGDAQAQRLRWLNELVITMPVPTFIKDAQSRFVMMNQACEQMFGVPFDSLQGKIGEEFWPPEQMAAFLANDRASFAARGLVVREELLWDAGLDASRQVQTFKKPMFNAAGEPEMLIGMFIDISEREQAKAALQTSLRQLRELSDYVEMARENEHQRIAREAHDELGQTLMALKIDVSMLHARTRPSHPLLHAESRRVLATLDHSIAVVRAIINELHPSTLELGLPAAVDWLLKRIRRDSGLVCRLHLPEEIAPQQLEQRRTWAVFRIIQEALADIGATAQASHVDVSLRMLNDTLFLTISHDGLPSRFCDGSDLAKIAVRERIAAIGGELDPRGAEPGCVLSARLPGRKKEREAAASPSDPGLAA